MISKGFFIRKVFIQSAPPPPRLKRLFAVFGFSAEGAFSFLTTGQKKILISKQVEGSEKLVRSFNYCILPQPLLYQGWQKTR